MTKLQRHITLGALVLYGMGDILGAGIYGLVGKAAGQMGNAVWMAFVVSMIAAGFTGLSYAALGSRHPRAGGASFIVHRAYRSGFLAYVVGLAVLASGLTSMATATRVFSGYLQAFLPMMPLNASIVGFALALALIVFLGIRHAIWVNSILAVIEIGGLLLIIALGAGYLGSVSYFDAVSVSNPTGALSAALLLNGAVLTFYSFIGFEDILNVSEEVVDPVKNLPRGLLMAVAFSSVIYVTISLIAVSVIPAGELAASPQPLVDVISRAAPWFPRSVYSVIALLAVSNTALLNYVMGSRLLYGMSGQGLLPAFLGKLNAKRATPDRAILVLLVILLALALSGDIADLARATSVLLLACFTLVNIALLILKRKEKAHSGQFDVPFFVPVCGALVSVAMLTQAQTKELSIAGTVVAGIVALYFFLKPRKEAIEKMEG